MKASGRSLRLVGALASGRAHSEETAPRRVDISITSPAVAAKWTAGRSPCIRDQCRLCRRGLVLSGAKTNEDTDKPRRSRALSGLGNWPLACRPESTQTHEPTDLLGLVCISRWWTQRRAILVCWCAIPSTRASASTDILLRYAENWAKDQGAEVMQLELLYPAGWESLHKSRLAEWYERIGYRMVRTEDIKDVIGTYGSSHVATIGSEDIP